jgi:hypothetical protein
MKGAPSFGRLSVISNFTPISALESVTLPVALPSLGRVAAYIAPGGFAVIIGAAAAEAAPSLGGRGHIFCALARAAQNRRREERIVIERMWVVGGAVNE